MSTDHEAIRQLIDTWHRASAAGDVDTVLSLMAPDAVFLVAGQPPMQGREVFAQGLHKVLADSAIESSSQIDEIEVVGDLAYCRTRLSVTIVSKHGKLPLKRSGHTLSILRKGADGRWLLTRDANMLAAQG